MNIKLDKVNNCKPGPLFFYRANVDKSIQWFGLQFGLTRIGILIKTGSK